MVVPRGAVAESGESFLAGRRLAESLPIALCTGKAAGIHAILKRVVDEQLRRHDLALACQVSYLCCGKLLTGDERIAKAMASLNERERLLLEKLGAEGKVTELKSDEVHVAKTLEKADLVFLVRDGTSGAVITPRGRRLLAELEQSKKSAKRPLGFLSHE